MKRKPTWTRTIGSISHATMRPEDLIPSFAYELADCLKRCRVGREDRKRFVALLAEARALEGYDSEEADYVLAELIDALDTFAPPHCYFGAHEGDGADYGFWPIDDDDELPRLGDLADATPDHWGEDAYIVNDHGNVSCGRFDLRGRWHEYWGVV